MIIPKTLKMRYNWNWIQSKCKVLYTISFAYWINWFILRHTRKLINMQMVKLGKF